MTKSPRVFKAGLRPSKLAQIQTRTALDRIEAMLPNIKFETVHIASVGDEDRTTDLRESPPDFFTRELDRALLAGEINCAVHSAKDLPDPMPDGIDWFWLPWREEPRDVLLFAKGKTAADLPENPVIGVSSDRRVDYCNRRFPTGIQKMIRGNIEERIEQLDTGTFDVVVMAAAALHRLGMENRISEWIELDELEVPDGQGYLAVTFRKGDEQMVALRSLFVRSVTFAGAGVGSRDLCTFATIASLQRADVCLYDSLIDFKLLEELPSHAEAIDVGKRCGAHSRQQHETTALICEYARQSKRVVRLKGGDPGIFGRLAEEVEALEDLQIPFRVIPGISALQAATTETGMLLTRRNVSRGFSVMTPRKSGGDIASVSADIRAGFCSVFYMSIKAAESVSKDLLNDGIDPATPAALIFNAGNENETITRTTLGQLAEATANHCIKSPGLILVGDVTDYSYNSKLGALQGRKILLTCSEALQKKASELVRDFGGQPIQHPLIKLTCRHDALLSLKGFNWLVITSPSSVRALVELIQHQQIDYRELPKIMVCGRGTADELKKYNLFADAAPESGFSASSLVELAKKIIQPNDKILRVRSDKAGTELADALCELGAKVDDRIIYDNEPVAHDNLPDFDAIFFASSSGVESFVKLWGADALKEKTTLVIGQPTAAALKSEGFTPTVIAREATVPGALQSLAEFYVVEEIGN